MTESKKQVVNYLKPLTHDPLVAQLQFISEHSRVPEDYLKHVGAKEFCSDAEMDWLRNAKKYLHNNDMGMVFWGPQEFSILKKMLAIGATLVRNYIDARVYSLTELLDLLDDRNAESPECTVIIIPDFCVADYDIPKRLIHKLSGFLTSRFIEHKGMIAYIDSYEILERKYGSTLANYVKEHHKSFSCIQEQLI